MSIRAMIQRWLGVSNLLACFENQTKDIVRLFEMSVELTQSDAEMLESLVRKADEIAKLQQQINGSDVEIGNQWEDLKALREMLELQQDVADEMKKQFTDLDRRWATDDSEVRWLGKEVEKVQSQISEWNVVHKDMRSGVATVRVDMGRFRERLGNVENDLEDMEIKLSRKKDKKSVDKVK